MFNSLACQIFKDEILKELNSGDDIIWIKNRPLISKKSPFWNGGGMVSQTDLDFFADNLHLIKNDCILISCYGARPIPSSLKTSSFEKIINCEKIKKWYTQNYDRTIIHEKLYPFPIGLPCVGKWYIKNNKEHTFNYILNVRDNIKKNEIRCFLSDEADSFDCYVEIHAGGKIDATSASGAMNMGSLTIDAGGTYLATSGGRPTHAEPTGDPSQATHATHAVHATQRNRNRPSAAAPTPSSSWASTASASRPRSPRSPTTSSSTAST